MKWLQVQRRAPGANFTRVIVWWTWVRFLVFATLRVLYRFRIESRALVPRTGPLIFASNHQTNLDPCIVGALTSDRPFAGIAQKGLFKSKLLSWAMRSIGVVSIDRSRGDTAAFKAALTELEAGRCMLIFPEGTRSKDGAMGPFKPGIMLLIKRAAECGVRVVPVAMEGAYDVWPHGRRRPRLTGRITVRAGTPISAQELLADGPEAGLERLQREIEVMRMELRAGLRHRTRGRYPPPGPGDQPYWAHQPAPAAVGSS